MPHATPIVSSSHPMAFRGRLVASTTPTVGKVSSVSTKAAPKTRLLFDHDVFSCRSSVSTPNTTSHTSSPTVSANDRPRHPAGGALTDRFQPSSHCHLRSPDRSGNVTAWRPAYQTVAPPVMLVASLLSESHFSGPPVVELDGRPLAVDTRKATAILAYVAINGHVQSRDVIATLLWPEYDGERARAALRRTLSTLRTSLGGEWLTTDRGTVALESGRAWFDWPSSDEWPTNPTADADELTAAVDLHRGELLSGFAVRDSAGLRDVAAGRRRRSQAGAGWCARPVGRRAGLARPLRPGGGARRAAAHTRYLARARSPAADRAVCAVRPASGCPRSVP